MIVKSLHRPVARLAAGALFIGAGLTAFAGVASAAGGGAAGNNGTVMINGNPLDSKANSGANDPHVTCPITISWSGFDASLPPSDDFTVTFAPHSPTGGSVIASPTSHLTGTFSGSNTENYFLAFTDAPQPHNGWHVDVTVETQTSAGDDFKYKTVWVSNCSPDFSVTKRAREASAAPGDTVHYDITVTNNGAPTIGETDVKDVFTSGLDAGFLDYSSGMGTPWDCVNSTASGNPSTTPLCKTNTSLGTGDSATFTVTAKVTNTANPPASVGDTVTASNGTTSKSASASTPIAAPSSGTLLVTGDCNATNDGYVWTVKATATTGSAGGVTGSWGPAGSGSQPNTFTTDANGDASFPTVLSVSSVDWKSTSTPNWTGSGTATPAHICTAAPPASGTVDVTGTCNANNNGYLWTVTTTKPMSGVAGTWGPHAQAQTNNFVTGASGTTTFASALGVDSVDWASTDPNWTGHGTANATQLCTTPPPAGGTVAVTGKCNTTNDGYIWTVTSTPAALGVAGTWGVHPGVQKNNFSTGANGTDTFTTAVGDSMVDYTTTTPNWSGAGTATASPLCVPVTPTPTPNPSADPTVSASNACKTGITVNLGNMNGTAPVTFSVTAPDNTVDSVSVLAGQIVKKSYAVVEDTTGTVTVSAPGLATKSFTYAKNCTQVLGEKVTKTPTAKPSPTVQGEKVTRLPFTGSNTSMFLTLAAILFAGGVVLMAFGARRRPEGKHL